MLQLRLSAKDKWALLIFVTKEEIEQTLCKKLVFFVNILISFESIAKFATTELNGPDFIFAKFWEIHKKII